MMNTSEQWVEALGWTLIHALWQAALVAMLARVILAALRAKSPSLASATYAVAMAAVLVGAAATFAVSIQGRALETSAGVMQQGRRQSSTPELAETPIIHAATRTPAAQRMLPWLVGAWVLGVAAMAGRLALGGLWIRRLSRSARPWEDEHWQSKVQEWRIRFGIDRAVRLCITTLHEAPAVIGHFKPIILLPAAIVARLTPEQLEAVLLHELMHIRRHDFLLNLARLAGETIFFFNPAVWWLSRAIRLEREMACDELAAAETGDKAGYARSLLRLEELRIPEGNGLAIAASSGSLKMRIARLLAPPQQSPAASGWAGFALMALLLAATAVLIGPRTVAANAPAAEFELRSVVPEGSANAEVLGMVRTNSAGAAFTNMLTISKKVLLDNSHFASAEVRHDPLSNRPEIHIRLTENGRRLFAHVTKGHVGKQIAIVIDGSLHSAPKINEPITGGSLLISGNFSQEEAEALARKLSSKTESGPESDTERLKAPRWKPPAGARPSQILEEARADRDAGRYEEALAKHIWYHTASRQEPGQGGVRLSFALSDWLKLGQAYPPALKALRQTREETEKAVRAGGVDVDRFTLFQEFAGFNWTLGEEEKTLALHRELRETDPAFARTIQPAVDRAFGRALTANLKNPEELQPNVAVGEAATENLERIRLARLLETIETIRTKEGDGELRKILPILHPDASLNRLLDSLASTEQALAGILTDHTEEHPDVVKLRSVAVTIRRQIDERIDGIVQGLRARLTVAEAVAKELEKQR
jgi:beta-lactamase regulating signal transducer with metallopeptidase domain